MSIYVSTTFQTGNNASSVETVPFMHYIFRHGQDISYQKRSIHEAYIHIKRIYKRIILELIRFYADASHSLLEAIC